MTVASEAADAPSRLRELQRVLTDNPVIILVLVLVALFVVTELVNRQQVGEPFITWNQISTTLLVAAPLAMLAGGQTLVMLTGGVDLSVAYTATAAAFAISWQGTNGTFAGILAGVLVGLGIGFANGIGVGIFRVNPLVMTLGTSSVIFGLLSIYAGKAFDKAIPDVVTTLGRERFFDYLPANTLLWAAVAAVLILGLSYSGYGRMLYAVGDNPVASRLAGVRVWQVLRRRLCALWTACGARRAASARLHEQPRSQPRNAVSAAVGRSGRDRGHLDPRRLGRLRRNDPGRAHPHGARFAPDAARCRRVGAPGDLRLDHHRAHRDLRTRDAK